MPNKNASTFEPKYTEEDKRIFLRALATSSDLDKNRLGIKGAQGAIKQIYDGDCPSTMTLHRVWKDRHNYISESLIQKWNQREPDDLVQRILDDGELDEFGERKSEFRDRLLDMAEGSIDLLYAYLQELRRKYEEEGTPPDRKDVKYLIDGIKTAGNQLEKFGTTETSGKSQAPTQNQYNVQVFKDLNPKDLDDKAQEFIDTTMNET